MLSASIAYQKIKNHVLGITKLCTSCSSKSLFNFSKDLRRNLVAAVAFDVDYHFRRLLPVEVQQLLTRLVEC